MIEADKVFDKLFESGYSHRFQWKDLNKSTTKYQVPFFCEKCELTSLHSFEVYVIDGKHYIRENALKIFLSLHGIHVDFDN